MSHLEISLYLTTGGWKFRARGGHPQGGDKINQVVSSWPGWSRVGDHHGPHRRAVVSTYVGPCSAISALALSSTSLALFWEEDARVRAGALLGQFRRARNALEDGQFKDTLAPATARQPRPFQRAGVAAMLLLEGRCWLSDDMGLGKTAQALWLAQCLAGGEGGGAGTRGQFSRTDLGSPSSYTTSAPSRAACRTTHSIAEVTIPPGPARGQEMAQRVTAGRDQYSCSRVLVLCPASVKFNWQKEIAETLGDTWPCQVIHGTSRQREKQFAELDDLWRQHERLIIVINYDLLQRLPEDQLERLERFTHRQLLLMDESHYLKNEKSQRTRIVRDSFCSPTGGARWRIAISGTPIRNHIDDVFMQVELVRPGTFYSSSWFKNRYTIRSTFKVPYTDKRGRKRTKDVTKTRRAKNTEELNSILNTFQVRRRKEDVTDLPPKVFTYPDLELDPHTAKVYAAMRDYALLLLEEHNDEELVLSPSVKTAVEAAARCEQIAQGCIGGVPEAVMSRVSGVLGKHAETIREGWLVFPKSTKLMWVREQLETVRLQGGRSVVFCRFNAPLLWLERQNEDYEQGCCVTGNMDAARRQEVFADFQNGDIQELYIQVKIAEGFNLHRAQHEFFIGRDWAPAVNAQAVDRCHRIGQTGTVNVDIPIMRGTIETRMHRALEAKSQDAANVLCFKTIGDLKEALE